MGKKQQALISDLAAKQGAVDSGLKTLRADILKVVNINDAIHNAGDDNTKIRQLIATKATPIQTMHASARTLRTNLNTFKTSLTALSDFAKKKEKRWFGKSTIADARTTIYNANELVTTVNSILERADAVK